MHKNLLLKAFIDMKIRKMTTCIRDVHEAGGLGDHVKLVHRVFLLHYSVAPCCADK